jgi:L-malate glycosyltransferase
VIVPTIRPEPLGLIIMEAALRGIPSIGSDTGGIPELIIDNFNGFLFRTGDADDLKEKLEQMLVYDITKISSQAAQHAQSNFGESSFVAAFIHLLTKLCNK